MWTNWNKVINLFFFAKDLNDIISLTILWNDPFAMGKDHAKCGWAKKKNKCDI